MRHFGWRWLAASSLLIVAVAAKAETRPQYGGTLRIEMQAAPASLDPADRSVPDSFGRRNVTALIFDTLVTFDDAGHVKPALAESWQATADQQLKFRIRRNVKFHDETLLTAESVAASVRFANPTWKVSADADSVVIQADIPPGDVSTNQVLAELALPRNAIVKRESGKLSGTGPFQITDWQAGSRLSLSANENCWRGRPFLDAMEIEMRKGYRDQMTAFQLGRADVVEVSPEQLHRFSQESRHPISSMPIEFVAMLFAYAPSSPAEQSLRAALGLSADRGAIRDVLLQGTGEVAGSILPTWMSGYGFVFSSAADLVRARQLRAQVAAIPNWKLGYNADDPLERLLAERIGLNAKDAGLSLQLTSTPGADLRIMRIPLESDAWFALSDVADLAGTPLTKKYGSLEELYAAEQALLVSGKLIPLLHLPASYTSAPNLRNWKVQSNGTLNMENAWLETTKP